MTHDLEPNLVVITDERLADWRAAAVLATGGEWTVEQIENREDRGKFTSYAVHASVPWDSSRSRSIADTLNSEVMAIQSESDDDGCHYSWDEVGERDAIHIANFSPANAIALLDALTAERARVVALTEVLTTIASVDDDGFTSDGHERCAETASRALAGAARQAIGEKL